MSHKSNPVQSFENERWSTFDQKVEFRHRAALELLPENLNSVLDIGCGEGTFLSLVCEKFPKLSLTGADMSEVALEKIKERKLHIKGVLVDASDTLPFEDGSFDVVSVLDVLEHTFEPKHMLAEIKRVSKKYIIIGVPNFNSLPARLQMIKGSVPENNKSNKGHLYWFNRKVLLGLITENDLRVVKELSNHQLQNKKLFGFLIGIMNKIAPSLFSLSFVVLVKKNK